jgi:hypothetical protein
MSFLVTTPESLIAAADELTNIGVSMSSGNAAVAEPTTQVLPPAADQVSALLATQFATHGAAYQTVASMASQIHHAFVSALAAGGVSYESAEAANAAAAQ